MRALLQRVTSASVRIGAMETARIGPGLLILLGVAEGDEQADARYVVDKAAQMRIFADEQGRFNRSVLDVNGELLVVSQFTLYADTRRGRRPDFTRAAAPDAARRLYEHTIGLFRETGLRVAAGEFRAYMYVQLENDGPVTILVDSADRSRPRRNPSGQVVSDQTGSG